MPYSDRHNVLFIHIPKTGGSSIEKALRLVDSETWGTPHHFNDPPTKYFANEQHLTFRQIKARRPDWLVNSKTILVSVRDPIDRIYSHFVARKGQWLDQNKAYPMYRFIFFVFVTVPWVRLFYAVFGRLTRWVYPQYEHIIPQYVYLEDVFEFSEASSKKLLFVSLFDNSNGEAIRLIHSQIDSSIVMPHLRNSSSTRKVFRLRSRLTDSFIKIMYLSDYQLMKKISPLINKDSP